MFFHEHLEYIMNSSSHGAGGGGSKFAKKETRSLLLMKVQVIESHSGFTEYLPFSQLWGLQNLNLRENNKTQMEWWGFPLREKFMVNRTVREERTKGSWGKCLREALSLMKHEVTFRGVPGAVPVYPRAKHALWSGSSLSEEPASPSTKCNLRTTPPHPQKWALLTFLTS